MGTFVTHSPLKTTTVINVMKQNVFIVIFATSICNNINKLNKMTNLVKAS